MSEVHVADTVNEARVLGVLWLAGAAITAVPAFMLLAVSDLSGSRLPGVVLLLLTVLGAAMGIRLLVKPQGGTALSLSLATSVVWLVGAVVVTPLMEFRADALWAGGGPALVALATGLAAWWVRRGARRSEA